MQEIEIKGLKEVIYYDVIEGLPVYIWKNEKVKGMISSLNVRYGSIHQEFRVNGKNYKVPSGIAHFLEHLNFYESDTTTATGYFSEYGSEVNAYTTFEYTSYYVYTTNHYLENLNHLIDFVLTPHFSKKIVNKERSIIIEETRADEDMPESNLYYTHYQDLFHKYKYRHQITGLVEDIKNITLEDIELVYQTFYHPSNMFLVVCGNVNQHEVFKLVQDNLNKKDILPSPIVKLKKYKEPARVHTKYEEIVGNVENPKVKISLKIPLNNFKNWDEITLRLITSLIVISNFGPTSDLKEYLMEEELISYMSASRSFIEDYILITITLETKYVSEVIDKIKESFQNLTMTESNLERKIKSTIATLVLYYDDINDVNETILTDVLYFHKVIDNVKEILNAIKLEDVQKVIQAIDTENLAITVLKPKSE